MVWEHYGFSEHSMQLIEGQLKNLPGVDGYFRVLDARDERGWRMGVVCGERQHTIGHPSGWYRFWREMTGETLLAAVEIWDTRQNCVVKQVILPGGSVAIRHYLEDYLITRKMPPDLGLLANWNLQAYRWVGSPTEILRGLRQLRQAIGEEYWPDETDDFTYERWSDEHLLMVQRQAHFRRMLADWAKEEAGCCASRSS